MWLWLVSTLLTASPAAPALEPSARPKMVVLNLQAAGGTEQGVAEAFTETLAVEAGHIGTFAVTSQKDMQTVLGVERQRELLGCGGQATSCMSELADALGARFVLSGSLTRLGEAWQLNLQMVDSRTAQPVGRSTRIATSLEVLRAQLPFALAEATATPPPARPSRVLPITLISVGGAAVVGSGVLFLQSITREQAVLRELKLATEQPSLVLDPAQRYRDEASGVRDTRIIGGVVAGVGAALIVAGVLLLPGPDAVVRVTVVPSAHGVALAGAFP